MGVCIGCLVGIGSFALATFPGQMVSIITTISRNRAMRRVLEEDGRSVGKASSDAAGDVPPDEVGVEYRSAEEGFDMGERSVMSGSCLSPGRSAS